MRGDGESTILRRHSEGFALAYQAKYNWDMEGFSEPVYVVVPNVAFAFTSVEGEFTGSATRWRFTEE